MSSGCCSSKDRAGPSLVDIDIPVSYSVVMSRRVPPKIIRKIKFLRERGWSLPEIRREMGVGNSTVFRHIQGVEILPEFKTIWLGKRASSIKRKRLAEEKAESEAEKLIFSLSKKEKTIFLSALYWGEGSKADFGLSNTDPNLIKIFIKGLEEIFGVSRDRLSISVRIYEDVDRQKALNFWSKITGISANHFISVNVLEGKKKGKLPYGMCRVRIKKGGNMLKYITALRNQIVTLFIASSYSSTDRTVAS